LVPIVDISSSLFSALFTQYPKLFSHPTFLLHPLFFEQRHCITFFLIVNRKAQVVRRKGLPVTRNP